MSRSTCWATVMLVGSLVAGCASTEPSAASPRAANVQPSSKGSAPVPGPKRGTAEDTQLVDDFVAFALDPGAATLRELPLSPRDVRLGLGEDGSPRESGAIAVAEGPHAQCVSPPIPAPSGLADLRRVSFHPAEGSIASCLEWFSVDLFLDSDRNIEAVTLDLWEP